MPGGAATGQSYCPPQAQTCSREGPSPSPAPPQGGGLARAQFRAQHGGFSSWLAPCLGAEARPPALCKHLALGRTGGAEGPACPSSPGNWEGGRPARGLDPRPAVLPLLLTLLSARQAGAAVSPAGQVGGLAGRGGRQQDSPPHQPGALRVALQGGPDTYATSPPPGRGLTSVAEPSRPAVSALAVEVAHEVLADLGALLIAGVWRALVRQL